MEVSDIEQNISVADEVASLTRNRSFKTKHLVRSQALRETQSPPRAMSPSQLKVTKTLTEVTGSDDGSDRTLCDDESSQVNECHSVFSDNCNNNNNNVDDDHLKKGPIEIQITTGAWESEVPTTVPAGPCERARWSGRRGLFAHEPRITCVCVVDDSCRSRRPKLGCSSKQDSGIVCSEECPEYYDCDINETSPPTPTKCDGVGADTDEQTSCSCSERKDIPKNTCLMRGDSDDRYEPTGMDLVNFIKETLNKNPKDRMSLLRAEKDLLSLVSDPGRFMIRFPVMSSYGRMLVHRCAALFELAHTIDVYSKCAVVVSKSGTSGGCIPCTSFRTWCTTKFPPITATLETQAKFILKRDAHSLDDANSNGGTGNSLQSKSLEQREKEYEKVRRRIFSTDNCHPDDNRWWCGNGPVKLYTSDNGKNKLIKVQSLEASTPTPSCRGAVAKSHSFGGYEPPPTRLLSRQGDLALSSWRLSPSSSGYKTLSLRSTDSVTPSPTGVVSPEPSAQNTERALMWAITEMSSVPEGSLIIHPVTCQPLRNPDGTIYHYDPANPPVIVDMEEEDKSDQNSEKKRGRLEKQHCFVDSEYECQDEDCRNKPLNHLDWAAEVAAENDNCDQSADGETETTLPPAPEAANQTESPPIEEAHEVQPCEVAVNEEIARPEPPQQECEQNGAVYGEECANGEPTDPPEEAQPSPPQEPSGEDEPDSVAVTYQENNSGPPPLVEYPTPVRQNSYTPHNNCRSEPNFRIDPSYQQYAELQASFVPPTTYMPTYHHTHMASCAGCPIDQATGLTHCRGYPLAYGQPLDAAAMVPHTYPMGNVMLQQHSMPPSFPYPPPPINWQHNLPLMTPGLPSNCPTPVPKPTSPPNLYLPTQEVQMFHAAPVNYPKQQDLVTYPINTQVYPLMQYQYPYNYPAAPHFQYYPQMYAVADKPDQARNSGVRSFESMQRFNSQMNSASGSARTTPLGGTPPAPEIKQVTHEQYDPRRLGRQTSLIEPNVQADNRRRPFNRHNSARSEVSNFAGQLQQLNEHMAHLSTDGHRNRNPGILGSYPHNRYFNYQRIEHDESLLTTAAREVVNSIRNLPPKNFNYHHYDHSRRNDNFQRNPFRQNNRGYDGYQRRDGRRGDDHANSGPKGSQEKVENVESNAEQKQLAPKEQNGANSARANASPQNGEARVDHHSRNRTGNYNTFHRTSHNFRQVPGWPRRSPGPHSAFNHQRRPQPEKRNE